MRIRHQLRIGLFVVLGTLAATSNATQPERVDFNRDIRPILTSHCTACHGGVQQAGDLSLVYPEPILNVVEPGDAENSWMMERILEEEEEFRMPPPEHGRRLNETEVELLKRWINEGAEWATHWAYQKPLRHEPPKTSNPEWHRQPLDGFVHGRLDAEGLKPSPDETPSRWLRRVSFDLVGLPPTPEQRLAFLADADLRGEPAYEAVVDRLLESPGFGERWASVWLDQVRYADSRGYGEDSPREIWKYRDWVIDALNQDMPYDQFTIKQLAGDLVPNRSIGDHLATAAHRLTHTNEEGGTDDEEFRTEAVLDRVRTTWQTWQATTIGCVQCHDHPYDPIKHEEFYESVALFNNTTDCDLSNDWPTIDVPLDTADYRRASELDREILSLRESVWQRQWEGSHEQAHWKPLPLSKAWTSNATKVVVGEGDASNSYRTVGTIASYPTISVASTPETKGPVTGISITVRPLDAAKAFADAELGFTMSHIHVYTQGPKQKKPTKIKLAKVIGDEPSPHDDPDSSLDEDKPGYGAFTRMHHPRRVVVLPEAPLQIEPGDKLIVRVLYRVFDLAAFSLVGRNAAYEISEDPSLTALLHDESLNADAERLESLVKERQQIPGVATPVLNEREAHLARPTHVFIRGLFLTKDKQVSADAPESLLNEAGTVDDRLGFARWLVSEENPLTARVAVNRFWARMFGVGLVATEEDFGSAGEQPSHPQLLDDLSTRFREDYGWSTKRLLREIALSSTYRQSSRLTPKTWERDPQNRLLARGPRHNLPAEAIRDQMLSISGLLSRKMHGPPVQPPLPPGVWKARRGKWVTPKKGDPDRYRRSVYTYVKRSVPFPTFATFDAPSRDFCQPKRLRSNTPLQSLMLLNDSAFVECAAEFAKIMNNHEGGLRDQIAAGFTRAACREPLSSEVDALAALYEQTAEAENAKTAMEAVAGVLLNLDEVIAK